MDNTMWLLKGLLVGMSIFATGFILYLVLTTVSGAAFRGAESWTLRSERRS